MKILDFGVAKVLDVAAEVERPALPHLVTEEGGFVGTPRVVAPEQALGRPVDARTDVYAAGLLLYTLIAGSSPFAHLTDAADLLKANADGAPRSRRRRGPRSPSRLRSTPPCCARSRSGPRIASPPRTRSRPSCGASPRSSPSSTGDQVTTGPLPPAVAHDARPDDPTLQLPAVQAAFATLSRGERRPRVRACTCGRSSGPRAMRPSATPSGGPVRRAGAHSWR